MRRMISYIFRDITSDLVTESGVQLHTAQKSIKRPGWWKGKFALLSMPGTGDRGEGRRLSKGWLHPPTNNQGARAFIDRGRGLNAETIVSSDSILEIGHQWSDQGHLDCFRYS